MAACRLHVELEESSRPRKGGESISGSVVVWTDKDVNCKALEVTSCWSTHGRGNIARGEVELATLHQGAWQASHEYRYPFKLATATWPPTFYGDYLNVSHFIEVRARVPWSTDPRTQAEYLVAAVDSPPDLAPTSNVTRQTALWLRGLGWLLGMILLGVLLLFFGPIMLILTPILIVSGGIYWLLRVYLPGLITGSVQVKFQSTSVAPGELIQGTCEFIPRRTSRINGISWTVSCVEVCSSGSGSTRQTHRNELLVNRQELLGETTLQSGKEQKLVFSYALPKNAAPSLKFTDNELNWSSELRIDIPKWPDFVNKTALIVKATDQREASSFQRKGPPLQFQVPENDDDPWLTEVLGQIYQSAEDPARLAIVVEALAEHTFRLAVDVEKLIDDPSGLQAGDGGFWVSALDTKRDALFALLCPSSQNSDQLVGSEGLVVSLKITGWDPAEDCIIAKMMERD